MGGPKKTIETEFGPLRRDATRNVVPCRWKGEDMGDVVVFLLATKKKKVNLQGNAEE